MGGCRLPYELCRTDPLPCDESEAVRLNGFLEPVVLGDMGGGVAELNRAPGMCIGGAVDIMLKMSEEEKKGGG